MIEPQPGVMVRGPASEGEEGRGWPVWVIAALALLSAACSSPRAPAPRRSGPDPFAPPRSARPKPEARDVEPGDLSSDSPALRAAAREKAEQHLEAQTAARELAEARAPAVKSASVSTRACARQRPRAPKRVLP